MILFSSPFFCDECCFTLRLIYVVEDLCPVLGMPAVFCVPDRGLHKPFGAERLCSVVLVRVCDSVVFLAFAAGTLLPRLAVVTSVYRVL
jgi:hypothetical protein